MVHLPWENDTQFSWSESFLLLWNPKVHYQITKTCSEKDESLHVSLHPISPSFNLILSFQPWLTFVKDPLPLGFPTKMYSFLHCATFLTHLIFFLFIYPSSIRWRLKTVKLLKPGIIILKYQELDISKPLFLNRKNNINNSIEIQRIPWNLRLQNLL